MKVILGNKTNVSVTCIKSELGGVFADSEGV